MNSDFASRWYCQIRNHLVANPIVFSLSANWFRGTLKTLEIDVPSSTLGKARRDFPGVLSSVADCMSRMKIAITDVLDNVERWPFTSKPYKSICDLHRSADKTSIDKLSGRVEPNKRSSCVYLSLAISCVASLAHRYDRCALLS